MKIVLQIFLGLSGLFDVVPVRYTSSLFGATGPGPFGKRGLAPGATATLLLDADRRLFRRDDDSVQPYLLLGD